MRADNVSLAVLFNGELLSSFKSKATEVSSQQMVAVQALQASPPISATILIGLSVSVVRRRTTVSHKRHPRIYSSRITLLHPSILCCIILLHHPMSSTCIASYIEFTGEHGSMLYIMDFNIIQYVISLIDPAPLTIVQPVHLG